MPEYRRPALSTESCLFIAASELAVYQFGITDLNGAIFDEWNCGYGVWLKDAPYVLDEAFWPIAKVSSLLVNGWTDPIQDMNYFRDRAIFSKNFGSADLPAIIFTGSGRKGHAQFFRPGEKVFGVVRAVIKLDYI
jgi:hypothetical protein